MKFRIKNKKWFSVLVSFYVIGWFYFCVLSGGILSSGPKKWVVITLILVPAIFWQTDLEGARLNKYAGSGLVINFFLIILGDAISVVLQRGSYIEAFDVFVLNIVIVLALVITPIALLFFIHWKYGDIYSYSTFDTIMTKEQHERFVKFIRNWEERFGKKRKRDE